MGPYLPEDAPAPLPIDLPEMGRTAFIGQFDRPAGTAPAVVTSLPEFRGLFGAAAGRSRAEAGIAAFFQAGGREALVVPADDLGESGLGAALARLGDLEFAMLAVPDAAGNRAFYRMAADLCAGRRALLLVDVPQGLSAAEVLSWLSGPDAVTGADVAVYAPWVTGPDGLQPPSGAAAGAIARTELLRGIAKAPAGTDAVLPGLQPELAFDDAALLLLRDCGANAVRVLPRAGTVLWGARTRATDPDWRYLNVRRTWQMLARALEAGLRWVVFEQMGPPLWAKVRDLIEQPLLGLWQTGALLGETPQKAYFVQCGPNTMTQDDIAQGRLVVQIGFALLRPGEFVPLRTVHRTATS